MEEVWKNLDASLWIKGLPSSREGPTELRYYKFVVGPTGSFLTCSSITGRRDNKSREGIGLEHGVAGQLQRKEEMVRAFLSLVREEKGGEMGYDDQQASQINKWTNQRQKLTSDREGEWGGKSLETSPSLKAREQWVGVRRGRGTGVTLRLECHLQHRSVSIASHVWLPACGLPE